MDECDLGSKTQLGANTYMMGAIQSRVPMSFSHLHKVATAGEKSLPCQFYC